MESIKKFVQREWNNEKARQANLVSDNFRIENDVDHVASVSMLNACVFDTLQALLKAVAFFGGAIIVCRNFGEAFAI